MPAHRRTIRPYGVRPYTQIFSQLTGQQLGQQRAGRYGNQHEGLEVCRRGAEALLADEARAKTTSILKGLLLHIPE